MTKKAAIKHILIVEDEPWFAAGQAQLLEAEGYEVKTVPHALAAIHEVDTFKPNVIVLDILLTGSTGYALLHELQSYSDTGGVPIIITTSLAPDIDAKELASYGVRKVLDKATMHPDDLLGTIRSVL
jgi:DNA-binding response OmpR family regulator